MTDPLGHAEASQYDLNGNLTQFTDRRGEVTVYQYDGLNRRSFADFGRGRPDESTISYTWDGGDRMTGAVDSLAGTISRSYDGLDNLSRRRRRRDQSATNTNLRAGAPL